jgi:glutamyl-tRNA synthetase
MDASRTRDALAHTLDLLTKIQDWDHTVIEPLMRELVATLGLKAGQLFGTVRTAISGRTATPPLFEMMEVLGRKVTLKRIEQAITLLS